MPTLCWRNRTIDYQDTRGKGPVMVFAHSFLMDGSMFHGLAQRFRHPWRCITWDARGHGKAASDAADAAPFNLDDVADDLAGLLQSLGIARAVVVGVSQGSQVAMRFALRHAQRARALVLMGAQASTEDPQKLPGHQSLMHEWMHAGLSDAMVQGVAHRLVDTGWHGTVEWATKWRKWSPVKLQRCFDAFVQRDDLSAQLSRIEAPTLVIHGGHDVCVSTARAQALAKGLPHAQWRLIPAAGHAPLLTHPAEVESAMRRFLALVEVEQHHPMEPAL